MKFIMLVETTHRHKVIVTAPSEEAAQEIAMRGEGTPYRGQALTTRVTCVKTLEATLPKPAVAVKKAVGRPRKTVKKAAVKRNRATATPQQLKNLEKARAVLAANRARRKRQAAKATKR